MDVRSSRLARGGVAAFMVACSGSATPPAPTSDVEPPRPSEPLVVAVDAPPANRSACELAAEDHARWFAMLLREHAAVTFPLPRGALAGAGHPVDRHTPGWLVDSRQVQTWGQREHKGNHWRLGSSAELAQLAAGAPAVRARLVQRREQEPTIVWPDVSTPHVVLAHDVSVATLRGLLTLLDPGDVPAQSKAPTSMAFVFRGERRAQPPAGAPRPTGRAGVAALATALTPCAPARDLLAGDDGELADLADLANPAAPAAPATPAAPAALADLADRLSEGLASALVGCRCSVEGDSLRRELWRVWGGSGAIAVSRTAPFAALRRHALPATGTWADVASGLPFVP